MLRMQPAMMMMLCLPPEMMMVCRGCAWCTTHAASTAPRGATLAPSKSSRCAPPPFPALYASRNQDDAFLPASLPASLLHKAAISLFSAAGVISSCYRGFTLSVPHFPRNPEPGVRREATHPPLGKFAVFDSRRLLSEIHEAANKAPPAAWNMGVVGPCKVFYLGGFILGTRAKTLPPNHFSWRLITRALIVAWPGFDCLGPAGAGAWRATLRRAQRVGALGHGHLGRARALLHGREVRPRLGAGLAQVRPHLHRRARRGTLPLPSEEGTDFKDFKLKARAKLWP